MSEPRAPLALIRGGGELATGAAHALHRAGARVLVLERSLPTALRLGVAFASAATHGRITVAGVEAVRATSEAEILAAWQRGQVAVWIDDDLTRDFPTPERLAGNPMLSPDLIVDARMRQLSQPITRVGDAALVIGIGPGFEVGRDAHFVVESNRGPALGRVIRAGGAEPYTGIPGDVLGFREQRILRAPRAGRLERRHQLGDFVAIGDLVAEVDGAPVRAQLDGMIRGLKLTGVTVGAGHKVGDVDPRRDRSLLTTMTDKALTVGRGVVRATRIGGVELAPEDRDAAPAAGEPLHRKEGTTCT